MTRAFALAKVATLLALVWLVVCAAELLRAQRGVATREAEATRRALLEESERYRALVAAESAAYRMVLDRRLSEALGEVRATRAAADARLQSVEMLVERRSGEALRLVEERSGEAVGVVRGIQGDVSVMLAETQRLQAAGTRAVELLTPQALGLVAAAKVTAGEAAQAARRIDEAVPGILATVQRAGDEYAETGRQTRVAMGNLAEATRPLPKWLRYPLSITGAMAPTVAGAVSAAAATGAFR